MSFKSIFRFFLAGVFLGIVGTSVLYAEVLNNPTEREGSFLLAQAKKVKICPSCGYENLETDMFCSECGAKLPVKAKVVSPPVEKVEKPVEKPKELYRPAIDRKIRFSLGYQQIPAKYYDDEWTFRYNDSVLSSTNNVRQLEENANSANMMVRITKMFPLAVSEDFLVGIEVGFGFPMAGFTKEWSLPTSSPTYTGEVKWYTDTGFPGLSGYYTRSVKDEIIVTGIPVFGRLAYNVFSDKSGIRIKVGLGVGVYFLNVKKKTTTIKTYTLDSPPYKKGETETSVTNTVPVPATELRLGAGELTANLDYKLLPDVSLGVGINLAILEKKNIEVTESTKKYYPSGTTTYPAKTVIKDGLELGGTALGLSAGVTLRF